MRQFKILLIEDEEQDTRRAEVLRGVYIEEDGVGVCPTVPKNYEESRKALDEEKFEFILIDVDLTAWGKSEDQGFELWTYARGSRSKDAWMAVYTGKPEVKTWFRYLMNRVDTKPVILDVGACERIRELFARALAERQRRELERINYKKIKEVEGKIEKMIREKNWSKESLLDPSFTIGEWRVVDLFPKEVIGCIEEKTEEKKGEYLMELLKNLRCPLQLFLYRFAEIIEESMICTPGTFQPLRHFTFTTRWTDEQKRRAKNDLLPILDKIKDLAQRADLKNKREDIYKELFIMDEKDILESGKDLTNTEDFLNGIAKWVKSLEELRKKKWEDVVGDVNIGRYKKEEIIRTAGLFPPDIGHIINGMKKNAEENGGLIKAEVNFFDEAKSSQRGILGRGSVLIQVTNHLREDVDVEKIIAVIEAKLKRGLELEREAGYQVERLDWLTKTVCLDYEGVVTFTIPGKEQGKTIKAEASKGVTRSEGGGIRNQVIGEVIIPLFY